MLRACADERDRPLAIGRSADTGSSRMHLFACPCACIAGAISTPPGRSATSVCGGTSATAGGVRALVVRRRGYSVAKVPPIADLFLTTFRGMPTANAEG